MVKIMSDQEILETNDQTINTVLTNLATTSQTLEKAITANSRIIELQRGRIQTGLLEKPSIDRLCRKIRWALRDPGKPQNAAFLREIEESQDVDEPLSPKQLLSDLEHEYDDLPDLEDDMRRHMDELEGHMQKQDNVMNMVNIYTEKARVTRELLDGLKAGQS